ncbi:nuclear transport factor 2 family protein [Pontibacter sp. JH31]|uniref:Nuclear transport factor 2 family protein n=1 Tax=Pontibacter aquaedesilientis TaxID=2766980 RepID=A0ABR7XL52_9BACT|nr:nuclear transport factor 2 family protein [Pontibacter aquaedesilientis]MBD1399010.1 nuclear transport factor 2 family protein [Pontibacter aquaedesilientis]
MKKLLFMILPFMLCAFQGSEASRDKALASMVEAERSFATTSVEKGIRAAFLEYLADDAVVFLPEPVNGKAGYGSRPESDAKLSWYPVYADISGSLDWGYTTGPYEFRANPLEEKPAGAGFYLSVWKKQPDGQWKVAIDQGNSYPVEQIKPEAYKPTAGVEASKGTAQDLLQKDEQKVQPYHDETLIYRAGQYPIRYKDLIIEPASNIAYTTLGHDISPAADMAYTYGSYTRGGTAETGYYLKVWKVLQGEWKLVAHNLVPDKKQ